MTSKSAMADNKENMPLMTPRSKAVLTGTYTWINFEHVVSRPKNGGADNDRVGCFSCGDREHEDEEAPAGHVDEQHDTMSYNMAELSTWQAFLMLKGSAWDNEGLWSVMLRTGIVATLTAFLIAVCTPDPTQVRQEKFAKLSTFLNVFVGLLLSFFMSSSMLRWYNCVSAFLQLFDAVRNLQMQCHALGVCRQREEILVRYGILSCWLLHLQLLEMAKIEHTDQGENAAMEIVWKEMMDSHPGLCLPEEQVTLAQTYEPAQTVWTWVASLVGRMALDGDIPGMPTPTYGRILNIVTTAHGAIREVRAAACVQAPFVYIHTLAVLVHFNNVINAISFGMVWGICLGKFLHADEMSRRREQRMYAREAQNLFIAFCLSMLGPFIYQALLEVSVCIARPFNNEDAMIPTVRLLKGLERDLCECLYLSKHLPHWEEPYFKAPAAPAAVAPAAPAAPAAVADKPKEKEKPKDK